MIHKNPFLGARPYGLAQAPIFFGRDTAGRRLAEMIAVVSPSGIGKTSLLRAAVVPELERSGLLPVYMRPDPSPDSGNDGAMALLNGRMEEAIAGALLPDMELESASLAAIAGKWGDIALQDAKARFAGLNPADPLRTVILDPGSGIVERVPMIGRYLNGTYAEAALVEQWTQLDPALGTAFREGARIGLLAEMLASPSICAAAHDIRKAVLAVTEDETPVGEETPVSAHAFGALRRLADVREGAFQLIRADGDIELKPRIVLVIDQFEQVFTLSHPESRDRLLTVLIALAEAALPVHIVLVRYLVPSSPRPSLQQFGTFHLDSMTFKEAEQIMVQVPSSIGAPPIPERQQQQLWDGLQVGHLLDPVTLSIACHELFELGQECGADEDAAAALSVEDLLGNYLERALYSLGDPEDISEAIDILSEIAGGGTTRDFVTQRRLLGAPLRDPGRRQRLLERLQRLFLIRGDSPRRGSEKLYDIMHERLIEPVRNLVTTRPDILRLRSAAARIVQPEAARLDLDLEDLSIVLQSAERLHLDARSSGILLSGLLQLDPRDRDKARVTRLARDCGASDPWGWYRRTALDLARVASLPAPDRQAWASRLAGDWWLTQPEVQRALLETGGASADEDECWLVLHTLLRQRPGERNRQCLRVALENLRSMA
jgi:hypothetical protein